MGAVASHIFNGGALLEDIKVFNTDITSDYYSISGAILGEVTLGFGNEVVMERASSFSNRVRNLNLAAYDPNDWRVTVMGDVFGLITPLFDENGLEQRGTGFMKDIFSKSRYIGSGENWGIGGTWARDMIYLENSLVIGAPYHGSVIGGGETFHGINNYAVWAPQDTEVTNIPQGSELDPNFYPGFDFNNIWEITNGSYPSLR